MLRLLREALFMLCCFLLILSYCPLLLGFFHTIRVQKSFLEFFNLSWSCKNNKSPFSPEKLSSVTASHSSSLLLMSLILLPCVYNPYFLSLCVGPHTHTHSHSGAWSPKNSKLGAYPTLCSVRLSVWIHTKVLLSCPPFLHQIRVGRHTAFCPLLVICLNAMKYFIFMYLYFVFIFFCAVTHMFWSAWFSQGCAQVWEAQASCLLFVAAQWGCWLWFLHFVLGRYSSPFSITGVLKCLQDYIHPCFDVQIDCCQNLQVFALSVLSLFFK